MINKVLIIFICFLLSSCGSSEKKPEGLVAEKVKKSEAPIQDKAAIEELNNGPANEERDGNKLFLALKKSVIELGFTTEKELRPSLYNVKPFINNGSAIIQYSARLINQKGERIDIVFYENKNLDSCLKSYKEIVTSSYKDIYFKEWSLVTYSGKNIILIKSGCTASKKTWKKITISISSAFDYSKNNILCDCGGRCITT